MTSYQRCQHHPQAIPTAGGCPACALHQQRLQAVREGRPEVQDGPYAYMGRARNEYVLDVTSAPKGA